MASQCNRKMLVCVRWAKVAWCRVSTLGASTASFCVFAMIALLGISTAEAQRSQRLRSAAKATTKFVGLVDFAIAFDMPVTV